MPERIRFAEARQVFEAFPRAANVIQAAPGEEAPLVFLRRLVALAHRFDAVTYAAYLLPRREAVWWGCQCVRALGVGKGDAALAAAEAWVRDPDEEPRRAALAIGEGGDRRSSCQWLALAAGQSGGSIAPEGAPPWPAAPHMTAVAVKCAVILAIAEQPARDQPAWVASCAEAAIRFAEGGDAKLRAPTPARAGAGRPSR
jgi:hypothetical protein